MAQNCQYLVCGGLVQEGIKDDDSLVPAETLDSYVCVCVGAFVDVSLHKEETSTEELSGWKQRAIEKVEMAQRIETIEISVAVTGAFGSASCVCVLE